MSLDTYERLSGAAEYAREQGQHERADELQFLADASRGSRQPRADDAVMPSRTSRSSENGILCSDIKPLPTAWLWAGRLPFAEVPWLFGMGGVGKGFFTIDLATRVTNGWPMPDGTPSVQGNVILVCPEDKPESTVVPRLMAAGADLTKVKILSKVIRGGIETTFTLPDDIDILREQIDLLKPVPFVVVDNLMAVANERVSTYRNQTVRAKIIDPLEQLAEDTGVCILVVAHLNKGNWKDILQGANGSKGITDAGRVVFGLVKDPTNPARRILVNAKNNLGPEARNMVYEIVESDIPDIGKVKYISGYDPSYVQIQRTRVLSEARQRILAVLESEDRTFDYIEINQCSGLNSLSNVRSHLSRMVDEGLIGYPMRNAYCSVKWLQELEAIKNTVIQKAATTITTTATITTTDEDASSLVVPTNTQSAHAGAPLDALPTAPSLVSPQANNNNTKKVEGWLM